MKSLCTTFTLLLVLAGCGPAHNAKPPKNSVSQSFVPVRTPRPPARGTTAIRGGTVMTGTGRRFENGVVVWTDGKITAVGGSDTAIPADARIVEASGKFVTPGIIDAHSHVGVYASPGVRAHSDGNEASKPNRADVDAFYSFWPRDPAIPRLVAGGVTTILVLPGSANLFGGRGAVFKLKPGRSAFEMDFPGAPDSLKMACGENPKRVYGEGKGSPQTRMGNVAGYREGWQKAREYQRKWAKWRKDPKPDKMPSRDMKLDTLVGVLEGKILIQNHCYRADEMEVMLTLAREYGYKVRAFHHAIEAYKVRDVLAAEGTAVATWADWWGFKMEAFDMVYENAALLSKGGVRVVIHSDSAMDAQRLNQEAAKAMWAGRHAGLDVSEDEALSWVTINPAWVVGVDEMTGSLEVGKMADVVIWSESPLTWQARALQVFNDGELEYDRNNPSTHFESDFELGLVPRLDGGEVQ